MGRRCVSDKIVESDDFYALSSCAQAVYFHLNTVADDDGFVNNASGIANKIKGGKKGLSDLVNARFLLKFGSLYVVKHWRISNSLKNDRLKNPQYPNIAAQIWVKHNRAYTDHPVEGCKTLLEIRTGVTLESSWNPVGIRLDSQHNITEHNITEHNITEHNLTEGDWGLFFKQLWDEYPEIRRGSQKDAKVAYKEQITSEQEASLALQNLDKWKKSKQWVKEGGRYIPNLCNWLDKGYWRYAPEEDGSMADGPRQLDEDEIAAIKRMLEGST